MKLRTLKESIEEAKRFIVAADLAYKAQLDDLNRLKLSRPKYTAEDYDIWYTKQSAACRRASMDLTRKLADLRAGR